MVALDLIGELGEFFPQPVGRRLRAGADIGKDERRAVFLYERAQLANEPLAGVASLGIRILSQRGIDLQLDFFRGGDVHDFAATVRAGEVAGNLG